MWCTLRLRGRTAPPLGGVITSSSIKIRRPGDNSRVRPGFRTAAPPVASMGGRFSITGGPSLLVCHGRAPCMGSLGSRQSSRCVFDKVCSSRISLSGKSRIFLFLSCEGIVIFLLSVGVPGSTVPSSDSFKPPFSCCIIILAHRTFFSFSSLCTPPCSAGVQSWSQAPKCSGSRRGGETAENDSWLQLNHVCNNRGSCLSHTTDTA